MARVSGATVLLILIATVSVYTCAIIAGAALGRALDRPTRTMTKQPPARDIALRISVSFRGLAEDFAKVITMKPSHLDRSRSSGVVITGKRDDQAAELTPAPATETEQQHIEAMNIQLARRGLLSNFSGEITNGARPRGAGGVVKVGPWGGSGGQGFYMPGARSPGAGGGTPRLLSVTLYHADAVHAFSFEYLLGGVLVGRTMAPSGGRSHGSKGLRATINFSPDEHLTAVEGTFGCCRSVPEVVITSLTFRTDKGRTYGPYGDGTGTPFSIPAANGCIVGFWGRSGWLLDAIGVYIMPCQV
ncbi:uncharacterized protein LOC124697635 [Lolium rigidum]|uniref:uncharacterized protein LOC124697635 n=1 Tax=Lolium rigidum TaxID=89674 RepID=UPI001F5C838E|nr:uncharacterized protein LOC124697635 [Lolium rigidum]